MLRGKYSDRTAAQTRANSTTARFNKHDTIYNEHHEAVLKLMRVLIRGRGEPEVDDRGTDLHIVLIEEGADRTEA